jgi:sortase B
MDRNRSRQEQKKGRVKIFVCILCLVGIVFCLAKIIPTLYDYRQSAKTYDELEKDIVSINRDPEDGEYPEAYQEDPDWWFRDVSIDFDSLQRQNSDIVAWIRFDHQDTIGIDYPVVYTDNNEDYIHKDIRGQYRKAGTLFFEALIEDPLSASHKKDILYGHLMKDGSMFAPLKKYVRDSSVYENNQYFTVYKKGAAYRYRIFSFFLTTVRSPAYTYGFTESDEEYRAHVDYLKSNSQVHSVEPDYEHSILTLSTCAKANSDQRIVVNAEMMDVRPTG